MPIQVFRQIKKQASHMAYNSVLYNWSLKGSIPERVRIRPVDPWPGDRARGQAFCEGALRFENQQIPLSNDWMSYEDLPEAWYAYVHGFSWLRDLRALSNERGMNAVAGTHAKLMIQSWAESFWKWHAGSWRMDIVGERLSMWFSAYEFYSAVEFINAEDEDYFEDVFFDAAIRQARHLSRCFSHDAREGCQGVGRLKALKGLLYSGIAFEGYDAYIEQALYHLDAELDIQIAGDGGHVSRSASQLFEALQVLLDIRMTLQAANIPLPEKIQHAIDRMGPALRFFRHNDKQLAAFNSTRFHSIDALDSVLRQAGVRGKTHNSLPNTGFERAVVGRASIVMDCGAPPKHPYDIYAHAAPLSFEMTYGRERVFVNCGTRACDPDWRHAMRSTAAHTALGMDHRNACEIRENGHFARVPQKVESHREDLKHAVLLEGVHDGYVPLNGFTHKRRVYLADQGHDLRGEDVLTSPVEPARPIDVAVRFHLHPKVMVSLIRDGQEALVRLPGGVGWRFVNAGGLLALEDSVYIDDHVQHRKTKQLVIYGQVTDKKAKIQWSLKREG